MWSATACAMANNLEEALTAMEKHLEGPGWVTTYMPAIRKAKPEILEGPSAFFVETEA